MRRRAGSVRAASEAAHLLRNSSHADFALIWGLAPTAGAQRPVAGADYWAGRSARTSTSARVLVDRAQGRPGERARQAAAAPDGGDSLIIFRKARATPPTRPLPPFKSVRITGTSGARSSSFRVARELGRAAEVAVIIRCRCCAGSISVPPGGSWRREAGGADRGAGLPSKAHTARPAMPSLRASIRSRLAGGVIGIPRSPRQTFALKTVVAHGEPYPTIDNPNARVKAWVGCRGARPRLRRQRRRDPPLRRSPAPIALREYARSPGAARRPLGAADELLRRCRSSTVWLEGTAFLIFIPVRVPGAADGRGGRIRQPQFHAARRHAPGGLDHAHPWRLARVALTTREIPSTCVQRVWIVLPCRVQLSDVFQYVGNSSAAQDRPVFRYREDRRRIVGGVGARWLPERACGGSAVYAGAPALIAPLITIPVSAGSQMRRDGATAGVGTGAADRRPRRRARPAGSPSASPRRFSFTSCATGGRRRRFALARVKVECLQAGRAMPTQLALRSRHVHEAVRNWDTVRAILLKL
jgi:hypothetical protein